MIIQNDDGIFHYLQQSLEEIIVGIPFISRVQVVLG